MSRIFSAKKIPIKVYYNNAILRTQSSSPNKLIKKKVLNINRYESANSLNKNLNDYTECITKESSVNKKYENKFILTENQKENSLLNNFNNHIKLKFHSKKINLFLNRNYSDLSTSPNYNINNTKYNKYCKSTENFYKNKDKIIKPKNKLFLNTNYKRVKSEIFYKKNNNLSNSNFFYNNNIYNKKYFTEIEKRGFNYNKLKKTILRKKILDNYNMPYKNRIKDHSFNNNELYYLIEEKKRKPCPQIKKFLIKRFSKIKFNNHYLNERISYFNNMNKGVINIKSNPNFKFHLYHDQNGDVKELDKPYIRTLKMTKEKLRDIKLMIDIRKIKDPEIIKMYEAVLHKNI